MDMDKENVIEILEDVAREHEVITDSLLHKLVIVEEILVKILKQHNLTDDLRMFDYKGFGFRWKGSKIAQYIHLCSINGMYSGILPRKSEDINRSFYYHNDFNFLTYYMSRDEILSLCKILHEFVRNMIAKIKDLNEREREFLEKFSNF